LLTDETVPAAAKAELKKWVRLTKELGLKVEKSS
jgi:hypothetical protein